MLWENHKTLAGALRDQALADCIAARFALRPLTFSLSGIETTLAHLVVAKCQQSVEKLTKGYLLWHSRSFDPTKGHNPFTRTLLQEEKQRKVLAALCSCLNKIDKHVVAQVKWLEGLAPHPPEVSEEEKGNAQPLDCIPENSEYPFWSVPQGRLVTAAEGMLMSDHAVRAIKALRTYLEAMKLSDPKPFTRPIGEFLDTHRFSTSVSDWPEPHAE